MQQPIIHIHNHVGSNDSHRSKKKTKNAPASSPSSSPKSNSTGNESLYTRGADGQFHKIKSSLSSRTKKALSKAIPSKIPTITSKKRTATTTPQNDAPTSDSSTHHAEDSELNSASSVSADDTKRSSLNHPRKTNPYTKKQNKNLLSTLVDRIRGDTNEVFDPKSWNGLPNGDFDLDLTYEQYHASKNLVTHWACSRRGDARGLGGNRNTDADHWKEGERQIRTCLGVVECIKCPVAIRPMTRSAAQRSNQLTEPCNQCGSELEYIPCLAKATVYKWKGGVHYTHRGQHNHRDPPPKHLTSEEEAKFEARVAENPHSTPLALVTGAPSKPSVSVISPLLINTDRVQFEQQKAKKKLKISASDDFFTSLEHFVTDYGSYLKMKVDGLHTIFSLQTPRMRTLALEDWTNLTARCSGGCLEITLNNISGLGSSHHTHQPKKIKVCTSMMAVSGTGIRSALTAGH